MRKRTSMCLLTHCSSANLKNLFFPQRLLFKVKKKIVDPHNLLNTRHRSMVGCSLHLEVQHPLLTQKASNSTTKTRDSMNSPSWRVSAACHKDVRLEGSHQRTGDAVRGRQEDPGNMWPNSKGQEQKEHGREEKPHCSV